MSAGLSLPDDVVAALRAQLPAVASDTVRTITAEVAEYGALEREVGATIERAVELALATFLRLAAAGSPGDVRQPALEGAYALGRGEARSGRTMDALLTAYRVGARVSWRQWSATAVENGLRAGDVARFAALVFAYIDELSAASAAGHTDELARTGRARELARERLATALLRSAPVEELGRLAERAGWPPPGTLTAVLVPADQVRGVLGLLPDQTLVVEPAEVEDVAVLLVPGLDRTRTAVARSLAGRSAVMGPARPWPSAASSYARAVRLLDRAGPAVVDTEQHLAELVLTADLEALADLRARVLEPLSAVRPASAERLAETLRSWLLHQGRRDDVAADLHVHPQTVRYRMTQVRELFGDRLADPGAVRDLVVALALPHSRMGEWTSSTSPARTPSSPAAPAASG